MLSRRALCLCALWPLATYGCSPAAPTPGTPDLDAVPAAKAGCETPTAANLIAGASMLPGTVCQECHQSGGQSTYPWTASGTVFASPAALCNPGGLAGVTVQILNAAGAIQATMTTGPTGNFYTDLPITFPITARINGPNGVMQSMTTLQNSAACASCHQQPPADNAPGRIALNL